MQFSLLTTVLTAVTAASAAATAKGVPTAAPFGHLHDAPTGALAKTESENGFAALGANAIRACSNPGFTGLCQYLGYTAVGTCYNVPSFFQNVISSVDVTGTGYQCYLYTGYSCSNDIFGPVTYYNTPISQLAAPFDNGVNSYLCF